MSIKTAAFISTHYPNTYMEQFCRSIHPDLELGPACVRWFRQATKHCTELITNAKAPSMYFWTTVMNFIFPESQTDIMSQKIPIPIHPDRLSMQDCQVLFLDIVNDYVLRAPRYAAESTMNVMLWQMLYSLMGILALGSLLIGAIFTFSKYRRSKEKNDPVEDIFKPEKRLHAAAKRSLNVAKSEVRQLQVKPIVQPEELIAPDGTAVLAVKLNSKHELLDAVVSSSTESSSRLYRIAEQPDITKSEFKAETVNKALRFLGSKSRKLRLLIIFEEEPFTDDQLAEKPRGQRRSPPPHKSSQIPNKHKRAILSNAITLVATKRTSCVETVGPDSPRWGSSVNKISADVIGDTGTPRSHLFSKMKERSGCPHSGSPKKQMNSPRSGNPATSSIPRTYPRHSPTLGAKKNI